MSTTPSSPLDLIDNDLAIEMGLVEDNREDKSPFAEKAQQTFPPAAGQVAPPQAAPTLAAPAQGVQSPKLTYSDIANQYLPDQRSTEQIMSEEFSGEVPWYDMEGTDNLESAIEYTRKPGITVAEAFERGWDKDQDSKLNELVARSRLTPAKQRLLKRIVLESDQKRVSDPEYVAMGYQTIIDRGFGKDVADTYLEAVKVREGAPPEPTWSFAEDHYLNQAIKEEGLDPEQSKKIKEAITGMGAKDLRDIKTLKMLFGDSTIGKAIDKIVSLREGAANVLPYQPVVRLNSSDFRQFPGMDRFLSKERADIVYEWPEAERDAAVNAANKTLSELRDKVETEAIQVGKLNNIPESVAKQTADVFFQNNYERDDMQLMAHMWAAQARMRNNLWSSSMLPLSEEDQEEYKALMEAQGIVPNQDYLISIDEAKTKYIEPETILKYGDVPYSKIVADYDFFQDPEKGLGAYQETSAYHQAVEPFLGVTAPENNYYHQLGFSASNNEQAYLPTLNNASAADWARHLYSQLSGQAKRRLLEHTDLGDKFSSEKEMDREVMRNPFVIHPRDIEQAYSAEPEVLSSGALEKGRRVWRPYNYFAMMQAGLDDSEPGFRGLTPIEQQQDLINKQLNAFKASEGVFDKFKRAGTSLFKSSGALVEGLTTGLTSMVDPDSEDLRQVRKLTPDEKTQLRAYFMVQNRDLGLGNSLTDDQLKLLERAKSVDKSDYHRIKGDIETHMRSQIQKPFVNALSEEWDALTEMLPQLAGSALGMMELPSGEARSFKNWEEYAGALISQSEDFWRDAGTGVVAGTVATFENPGESFLSMPIGTTLTLFPAFRMVKNSKLGQGLTGAGKKALDAFLSKAQDLSEATGILSNPVSAKGLERLKQLDHVITKKSLQAYEKVAQTLIDPVSRAAKGATTAWSRYFVDKLAQAESAGEAMLNKIFRHSPEEGRKFYHAWLGEKSRIAREGGGWEAAFNSLDTADQHLVFHSAMEELARRGVTNKGSANYHKAIRDVIKEQYDGVMLQNNMGDTLLQRSGVGAGGQQLKYHGREQPFQIARQVMEEANRLTKAGLEETPLTTVRRTTDRTGHSRMTGGHEMLHTDPQDVIALLKKMLDDETIWTEGKITPEQIKSGILEARKVKARGEFGRVVQEEIFERLDLPTSVERWDLDPSVWKRKGFRESVEKAIKELEQYEPLSNKSRVASGMKEAILDEAGNFVSDPLHHKGTWVHRAVNEFIEEGSGTLPWRDAPGPEVLNIDPGFGPGQLLDDAGNAIGNVSADAVKSDLWATAHQLKIPGLRSDLTRAELETAIRKFMSENPRKTANQAFSASEPTRNLIEELQMASYRDYKKGPVTPETATPQTIREQWSALTDAIKGDDAARGALDAVLESSIINRGRELMQNAELNAVRSAILAESTGALERVAESISKGKRVDSLPGAIMASQDEIEKALAAARNDAIAEASKIADSSERGLAIARIERSYVDASARFNPRSKNGYTDLFRGEDGKINTSLRREFGFKEDGQIWVPKQLEKQLQFEHNITAKKLAESKNQVVADLSRLARAGQTVYNPVAITNNTMANFMHAALRRKVTPVELALNFRRLSKMWDEFEVAEGVKEPGRGGVKLPEGWRTNPKYKDDYQMYLALKEVGLDLGKTVRGGSDMVSGELLGKGGKVMAGSDNWVNKIAQGVETLGGSALRKLHSFTDDIFRIEDSVNAYKIMSKELDVLEPNVGYRLRTGQRTHVDLVKNKDGKMMADGKVLTDKELNRVKARAAKWSANSWLVNYADQPNFPALLRANRLTGAASPHNTWQFNAMAVPGRGGIISRIFVDGVEGATKSPAILAMRNKARAWKMPITMFMNGLEKHMFDSKAEVLRMANAYNPASVSNNSGIMELWTNPLSYGWDSTRAQNLGEPLTEELLLVKNLVDSAGSALGITRTKEEKLSDLLNSVAKGSLKSAGYSANKVEDLTKEERKRLDDNLLHMRTAIIEAGQSNNWAASAKVLGLAGNNLMQLLIPLTDEGRHVNMENLLRHKALPILMTGGGAKAMETLGMAVAPESPLVAYRKYGDKAPEEQVDALTHLLNTWTGLASLPRVKKGTLDMARMKLKKTLSRALIPRSEWKKIQAAKRVYKDPAASEEQKAKAAAKLAYADLINKAVRKMDDQFNEMYEEAIKNKEKLSVGLKGAKPMEGIGSSGINAIRARGKARDLEDMRRESAHRVLMEQDPGYKSLYEEDMEIGE